MLLFYLRAFRFLSIKTSKSYKVFAYLPLSLPPKNQNYINYSDGISFQTSFYNRTVLFLKEKKNLNF